ncbi:MAG: LysR substrate-binding domain-containing protein [Cardiobacteriaceae bacterium]|nr:LysR substrate-binding domain-containing protein [Cardiobacteriaceae bacterium]
MKLKQLQCVVAVVENGFNVTAAAEKLHISQPAVSKQIKMVEEALGLPVFRRNSKNLIGLTDIGEAIMPDIEKIMTAIANIQHLSTRSQSPTFTQLSIATTNTLASYRLSSVLPAFQQEHPQLPINVSEGTNRQILSMVQEREVDFGWFSASSLTTYTPNLRGLHLLSGEPWHALAIMPKDHPLTKNFTSLSELAAHPLITYITSHKEPTSLSKAMNEQGLTPRITLTARNNDMIKNYVRQGLGVGIIADIAYNPETDHDLAMQPLDSWLPPYTTYLVWHHEMRLRNHHYAFISKLVKGANRASVEAYIKRLQIKESADWAI